MILRSNYISLSNIGCDRDGWNIKTPSGVQLILHPLHSHPKQWSSNTLRLEVSGILAFFLNSFILQTWPYPPRALALNSAITNLMPCMYIPFFSPLFRFGRVHGISPHTRIPEKKGYHYLLSSCSRLIRRVTRRPASQHQLVTYHSKKPMYQVPTMDFPFGQKVHS